MPNRLFIIEAPGKEHILNRILFTIYKQRCEIIATRGHICGNPPTLSEGWINDELSETAYCVKKDKLNVLQKIRLAAGIADEIYLATDDDHEGDVIARDVVSNALNASEINKLFRVRLRAMTIDEVRRTLSEREPYYPDANKGDARRIVDRLIGSLSSREGAIGRVQGSLLIELDSRCPVVGMATLSIPSSDGKSLFTSALPVFAGEPIDFDELNDLCRASTLSPGQSFLQPLASTWNHSDILINCSLATDASPSSIAAIMQKLYEKGEMTYPRSSQRTLSPETLNRTQLIARMQGTTFKADIVRGIRKEVLSKGHEAPSIIQSDIPLNRKVDGLVDLETAVKILVARNQVECGIPCKFTIPNAVSLDNLPEKLKSLNWHSKSIQGICLWHQMDENKYQRWTMQQSILHFMQQTNLGRPSTVIQHIEKFIIRELINNDFTFTEKGSLWLINHKDIFHNKSISNIIEQYLEANNDSPDVMVRALIEICGLDVSNSISLTSPNGNESQEYTDNEFSNSFN